MLSYEISPYGSGPYPVGSCRPPRMQTALFGCLQDEENFPYIQSKILLCKFMLTQSFYLLLHAAVSSLALTSWWHSCRYWKTLLRSLRTFPSPWQTSWDPLVSLYRAIQLTASDMLPGDCLKVAYQQQYAVFFILKLGTTKCYLLSSDHMIYS